jgi:hypothetical protein
LPKPDADRALAQAARRVLRGNDAGRWTVPSPAQYPHQWNWDSAFVSLGWATFDWTRATVEIESMLGGRWREGMVPHVRYDPAHVADYFPGPDRWPRARAHVAEPGQLTSGITNPPMLVPAALRVGRRQPARDRRLAFWRRNYAALHGYVEYLARRRALAGSPLVAVVHPWEGGWDNSPRWDGLDGGGLRPAQPWVRLDTLNVDASERPRDRDYDLYLSLIELLDGCDYDVLEFRSRSPFLVYDVLVDALWYAAALALNEIAVELELPPAISSDRLDAFATAFEEAHWDPGQGLYVDWDCVGGRRIARPTAAGLAALAGGVARRDRALAAWSRYAALSSGLRPVCTVPPGDPAFDPRRYWRGPVWVSTNWLVGEGLELAGLPEDAAALRRETVELVRSGGFAEYFDPVDGSPRGSPAFSWSAALVLDLLDRQGRTGG